MLRRYDDVEAKVVQGLYLYYAAHIAETNGAAHILLATLRPGDKVAGKALLLQSAFRDAFAGTEAAIYYLHIMSHFESDWPVALKIAERLFTTYPKNFKFKEAYIECLLANKNYQEALPLLNDLKSSANKFYHSTVLLFDGILQEEFYGIVTQPARFIKNVL